MSYVSLLVNLFLLWRRQMKLRKVMKHLQLLNVLTIIGQVAAALAGVYPEHAWILTINAVVGALLPSFGGVAHAVGGTEVVPK